MPWLSLRIATNSVHAEALSDYLMEIGALSVSVEDADAGTPAETPQFGEPGDNLTPEWTNSYVLALFEQNVNIENIVEQCESALDFPQPLLWDVTQIADENWVELTQAQFAPIRISDRLWIVPTWHEIPDPKAITLILDPGMAFGTGSHPTTQLCLNWLEKNVAQNASVLDYGCGSGILAIAAKKLGASDVLGADIDQEAVKAAVNNAARNNTEIHFFNSTEQFDGQFDLVVANILANPLKALAPLLSARVKDGGKLALSGILFEQAEEMIAIYAPYILLKVEEAREGWICLAGTKLKAAGENK